MWNVPTQKIRDGFLAAATIGYLCKHNAAITARDMNAKYKETSEAGLAALVLC